MCSSYKCLYLSFWSSVNWDTKHSNSLSHQKEKVKKKSYAASCYSILSWHLEKQLFIKWQWKHLSVVCASHKSNFTLFQGCRILHPNYVRLAPNGTNLWLFKISFSRFRLAEIYWNWSLKVPDLSHLGPIWHNLDAKFGIPGLYNTHLYIL